MKQTFTDTVEIDAPTQLGLVVTGPVTGVGAGAQLTTTGTGGRGWEILATGQAAAQGRDKLNIRDLGNGQDVFTITSDGKVGIRNTNPGSQLHVEAPNEAGLSVFAPDMGNGAGAILMNRAPGFRGIQTFQGWEILATGQTAAQGSDKLNIARQSGDVFRISSKDIFTITSDGKVGIGTTSPGFMLEIDAPNQLGLHVTGPNAGSVGAGMSLSAVDPATAPGSNWEILATGSGAAQGPGRLNIRDLRTHEDIFTIQTDALGSSGDAIGIGTTTPTQKLEVNGAVLAQNFIVSSSRTIKDNIFDLCTQEALEALEHLSPMKFNYKTQDAENVRIGFIAEDVPELVASADRKGVSFTDIVGILTQVVKEQQKMIKTLVEKSHMLELAVNGARP
jgi:hypothetical protein